MGSQRRPLELILARNLVEVTQLPSFLVDGEERIVFYNIAAGELLGQRFEEFGQRSWREWRAAAGTLESDGEEVALEVLPVAVALREGRPSQRRFRRPPVDGHAVELEASALPIVGPDGVSGVIVTVWRVDVPPVAEL